MLSSNFCIILAFCPYALAMIDISSIVINCNPWRWVPIHVNSIRIPINLIAIHANLSNHIPIYTFVVFCVSSLCVLILLEANTSRLTTIAACRNGDTTHRHMYPSNYSLPEYHSNLYIVVTGRLTIQDHRWNYQTISINLSSETIVGRGVAALDESTHSSKPISRTVNYLKQPITAEMLLAEVDRIASAGVIKLDELTIHVHQGRLWRVKEVPEKWKQEEGRS